MNPGFEPKRNKWLLCTCVASVIIYVLASSLHDFIYLLVYRQNEYYFLRQGSKGLNILTIILKKLRNAEEIFQENVFLTLQICDHITEKLKGLNITDIQSSCLTMQNR